MKGFEFLAPLRAWATSLTPAQAVLVQLVILGVIVATMWLVAGWVDKRTAAAKRRADAAAMQRLADRAKTPKRGW